MLLFIFLPAQQALLQFCVSIHLMLLFIAGIRQQDPECHLVSIHLMLLFIPSGRFHDLHLRCFNTSHVTLYRHHQEAAQSPHAVSIHLMLLFINVQNTATQIANCFNTSHVTLYLSFLYKHSATHCFNTSHVTLYQRKYGEMSRRIEFQYISCYSLSDLREKQRKRIFVSIHLMLLFIVYQSELPHWPDLVSIHLMLLFIGKSLFVFPTLNGFNTSHVTLYPSFATGRACGSAVSIHLMLLFIKYEQVAKWLEERFNTSHVTLYLVFAIDVLSFPLVSIHLMLLFIVIIWNLRLHPYQVSIHLMLLFIPRFIGFSSSNSFYNTAKYKGLQDFYQPTSHFLFTQSKPGIPTYFQYFSFFYENPPGNFYNFSFNLLREFPCHVFTLTGEFFYYKIKSSPLSFFPFPSTSSPNTLSFINFIIHTKSSSLSITRFSSFLNCMNFDGVMSPLKTDFWK